MPRLRLQHFVIQPILLVDDGTDELLSLDPPVPPQAFSKMALERLLTDWPKQLAELQAQFDEQRKTEAETPTPSAPHAEASA